MRSVVTTRAPETGTRGRPFRRGEVQPAPRQTRVILRRVDPWSVFKFSLLFYFCLMLIFEFALLILYWILGLLGVLDSLSRLLGQLMAVTAFHINGFWIFSRLFLVGIIGVFVWSVVNFFVTLLYNLVSDVVGGIQVTLAERR
jgi:transmembrane protein DUF3566